MEKRIMAVVLALFYSIAVVIAGPMAKAQDFAFRSRDILPLVLCFVFFSTVNLMIIRFFPGWYKALENDRIRRGWDRLGEKKGFLCLWGLIFLLWLPAWLILFPGVLSYDILSQVGMALGTISNNHHPVLHTWLLRVFMRLGAALMGSYESGLGVLSLLQMILLSYALTRLTMLLKDRGVPILCVILTGVLSGVWFLNACLAVTMVKDTLHAAFLVLFVCHFVEIATQPAGYLSKKSHFLTFPAVSFLMCAFRNNGIYIYVFCFAALLLLRLTSRKRAGKYWKLILMIFLPFVLFRLYSGPVFTALGIEQGQVREALSIPIQQMQRVAVNHEAELTNAQVEQLDYYIDNLKWLDPENGRAYDPFISDPAKSCFYSDHYKENPVAFWRFYGELGLQFSREYVEAFLSNTLGYWYPGFYEYSYVMYENYPTEWFETTAGVTLERRGVPGFGLLKHLLQALCEEEGLRRVPLLRVFFVPGFALWILLGAMSLAWRKKGYFTETLPMFLPLIAQFGIMILSPMSSFRYSWPFYLMLPLVWLGLGETANEVTETKAAETRVTETKAAEQR